MEGLELPALAQIGRILEVSGDGLLSDLFIQVLRYPEIDGTRLAVGLQVAAWRLHSQPCCTPSRKMSCCSFLTSR